MHRQELVTCEKILKKKYLNTLTSMNNLALILNKQGKYEAAETIHRQTLAIYKKILEKKHPNTLTSIYCLTNLLAQRNSYDKTVTLY